MLFNLGNKCIFFIEIHERKFGKINGFFTSAMNGIDHQGSTISKVFFDDSFIGFIIRIDELKSNKSGFYCLRRCRKILLILLFGHLWL